MNSPPSKRTKLSSVDQLSLDLLLNKTHYKSLLKEQEPESYTAYLAYLQKLKKYESNILTMVEALIQDPQKPMTQDIQESWETFSKAALRYLQKQERDLAANEDDATLFGDVDDV